MYGYALLCCGGSSTTVKGTVLCEKMLHSADSAQKQAMYPVSCWWMRGCSLRDNYLALKASSSWPLHSLTRNARLWCADRNVLSLFFVGLDLLKKMNTWLFVVVPPDDTTVIRKAVCWSCYQSQRSSGYRWFLSEGVILRVPVCPFNEFRLNLRKLILITFDLHLCYRW